MSRRTANASLALFALLAVGASVTFLNWGSEANGAQAPTGLVSKDVQEDQFLNYDFLSESASPSNVDWAISLIFTNSSSISKVKYELRSYFPNNVNTLFGSISLPNGLWETVSSKKAKMTDGVRNGFGGPLIWDWDTDRGLKTVLCPSGGNNARHIRIYAPDTRSARTSDVEALYNMQWSYYVIASVHEDHNECSGSGAWFGESEKVENWVAEKAVSRWGLGRVMEDKVWLSNQAGYPKMVQHGDHRWFNNGWATRILVP